MGKYVSDFQTLSNEKLDKIYTSQQHELSDLTIKQARHKPYHTFNGDKIGEVKPIKKPKITL